MSAHRRPRAALLAVALSAAIGGFVPATTPSAFAAAAQPDIAYEQFTLPNGLRVIVHTDRKAPIVAVNIWYGVASKDEPAGRSGFAHLFEHLMFNGSENHRGEFFDPFEKAGATDMNGTTNTDRTNYFENVPTTALDMALWMESDRMGHLLGAIDQKVLDEQRGVVQNEKRQGQNQPYGQLWDVMAATMYPEGHPYHHTVIGSMNDLNAASLEDVKQWFRYGYGPNNAVLVLAGDIDVATAKEKVAKYFGDIPAGPTLPRLKPDVPKLAASGRTELEDKVPQVRTTRVWNVAPTGTVDADLLDLFQQVLGGSASSRLDQRLVHQEKLVDSVSTYNYSSLLAGQFGINAMVKQGVDEKKVEAIIDEELQKLLKDGPTAEELQRAKTTVRAGFIRGIERIGGFGGKADALASCATFVGDPGCFRESLKNIDAATPESVRAAGAKWLQANSHTFVVKPGQRKPLPEAPAATPTPLALGKVDSKFKTLPSTVDRKQGVPAVEKFPELKFPAVQHATLSNGTKIVLAERHEVPVVQFSYQFAGGGQSTDGAKPGIANFAAGLLGEGAGAYDALAFKSRSEDLGASIGAGASKDGASASLSALKENLEPSLALFADLLQRPRFEQKEIDRVKAQWIAGIQQEKARPQGILGRVTAPLLYGAAHPYATPASGTEASIAALTRADLLNWHAQWLRPETATLIVVGDTTLAEIVPLLEKQFGNWKPAGSAPALPDLGNVALPAKERVFLIDQPGAVQANILGAQLVPSTRDPEALKLDIANSVLGGEFSSRLNMNLREDKHWAYGSYSGIGNALGQRAFQASAAVQIDKAAESLAELRKEIRDYASGARPATEAELARIQATEIRGLPGAYETAGAVQGTLAGIVRYGRPDDYVFRRKAEIESLTPAAINEAAKTLKPEAVTWVVVGDLSKIEAPIRALNIGEVTVLDADGKVVKK